MQLRGMWGAGMLGDVGNAGDVEHSGVWGMLGMLNTLGMLVFRQLPEMWSIARV